MGYVQFNLGWAERRGAVIDIPKSLLVKLKIETIFWIL